jgi:hypothetical protein
MMFAGSLKRCLIDSFDMKACRRDHWPRAIVTLQGAAPSRLGQQAAECSVRPAFERRHAYEQHALADPHEFIAAGGGLHTDGNLRSGQRSMIAAGAKLPRYGELLGRMRRIANRGAPHSGQ